MAGSDPNVETLRIHIFESAGEECFWWSEIPCNIIRCIQYPEESEGEFF